MFRSENVQSFAARAKLVGERGGGKSVQRDGLPMAAGPLPLRRPDELPSQAQASPAEAQP